MGVVASDYYLELAALLPPGPAWDLDAPSVLTKFLEAWSQELARIQARADSLVAEADPCTTNEVLADYERIFGLPTDCMTGIIQTLQQRHSALVAQMTGIGGQSISYFINLAASAGYTITITEFTASTVAMTVADAIVGGDWTATWQVNAVLNAVTNFLADSLVDEALGSWGNTQLECLINRFKPAHTHALFSYT